MTEVKNEETSENICGSTATNTNANEMKPQSIVELRKSTETSRGCLGLGKIRTWGPRKRFKNQHSVNTQTLNLRGKLEVKSTGMLRIAGKSAI